MIKSVKIYVFLLIMLNVSIAFSNELHDAIRMGNDLEIPKLLKARIDVNSLDNERNTPLILASIIGNHPIVRLILYYKADVNSKNIYGFTAVHYASALGYMSIVRMLVEKKVDVNAKSERSFFFGDRQYSAYTTPLICAVRAGHADIVKYLIENNASPDSMDSEGRIAGQMTGSGEILKLLYKDRKVPGENKGNFNDITTLSFIPEFGFALGSSQNNLGFGWCLGLSGNYYYYHNFTLGLDASMIYHMIDNSDHYNVHVQEYLYPILLTAKCIFNDKVSFFFGMGKTYRYTKISTGTEAFGNRTLKIYRSGFALGTGFEITFGKFMIRIKFIHDYSELGTQSPLVVTAGYSIYF